MDLRLFAGFFTIYVKQRRPQVRDRTRSTICMNESTRSEDLVYQKYERTLDYSLMVEIRVEDKKLCKEDASKPRWDGLCVKNVSKEYLSALHFSAKK